MEKKIKIGTLKKVGIVLLTFVCIISLTFFSLLCNTNKLAFAKPDGVIKGDTMLYNGPFAPMCIEEMGATVDINSLSNFNTDSKQISINNVYGASDRSTIYVGEVPPRYTEGVTDDWSNDHPSIGERWINGAFRSWALNPLSINNNLGWGEASGKAIGLGDGETADYIHAVNLTGSNANFIDRIFTGANFGYSFFAMFNALWSWIVNIIIFVSNFDVPYIMHILNLTTLEKTMNDLFIQNDNGFSGVMIIAAIMFIVSLIAMLIKRITKGDTPLGALFKEILMMCLAFVLAWFCLANGPTRLADKLSDVSSALINALTNPGHDETAQLFQNDSGKGHEAVDCTNTLSAMFSQVFIDMVIRNQFGVPVSELYVWDDKNSSYDNWGFSPDEAKQLCERLTRTSWTRDKTGESALGQDVFAISNRIGGNLTNASEPNLGYYWYAVVSDINVKEPFYEEDEKLKMNRGDRDYGPLYIVDFLSGVDAKYIDDGGSVKARTMIEQFKHPVKDIGQMFACSLVSLSTIAALVIAGFYSLVGKLIFNIGALFIPIIPVMLLIPFGNLRKTTLDLVKGWGIAALKMVVGQVYIVVVITFSVALSSTGIVGMFLDVAFLLGMFFGSKKLFSLLNATFGQHEPGFMRSIDRGFDKATGWMASFGDPAKGRQRLDNLRNKMKGRKEKGMDNGAGNIKDPNQNTLTNAAQPGESEAMKKARAEGDKMINDVKHRSPAEIARAQNIKDEKFLGLLEKQERLANEKGHGFMAKIGGKLGKAQEKILNSYTCQDAIQNNYIGGKILGATAAALGAASSTLERPGIINAAQTLAVNTQLSAFEATHNIDMDGTVTKAGVRGTLKNLGKKAIHASSETQFTFDKAQEAQTVKAQKEAQQTLENIQKEEKVAAEKAAAEEQAKQERELNKKIKQQVKAENKKREDQLKQLKKENKQLKNNQKPKKTIGGKKK